MPRAGASFANSGMSAASRTRRCNPTGNCRSRPRPSPRRATPSPMRDRKPLSPRVRWKPPSCLASSRNTATPRRWHERPDSTASKCMPPTATCSTNSCATAVTSVPMPMAAASTIAPDCCWKCWRRSARYGAQSASACVCLPSSRPTTCATRRPRPRSSVSSNCWAASAWPISTSPRWGKMRQARPAPTSTPWNCARSGRAC